MARGEFEDPTDAVGELLFNRGLRLRFALWVLAQGGRVFYTTEAVFAFPKDNSNVRDELKRLVKLGMVRKLPSDWVAGNARKNYVQTESPLWSAIARTGEALNHLRLLKDVPEGEPVLAPKSHVEALLPIIAATRRRHLESGRSRVAKAARR